MKSTSFESERESRARESLAGNTLEARFLRFRGTGNREELELVVRSVRPELLRIATYYLRRSDAAEDAVQEAVLAAIESRDRFHEGRRLIPWLCGILLNKISEYRRALGRGDQRDLEELEQDRDAEPGPLAVAQEREVAELVTAALDQLPAHYRDVLRLHLEHGLGRGEIAARLQRPESTIRAQILRGLVRLRALLPASLATGLFLARRKLGSGWRAGAADARAGAWRPVLSGLLATSLALCIWLATGIAAGDAVPSRGTLKHLPGIETSAAPGLGPDMEEAARGALVRRAARNPSSPVAESAADAQGAGGLPLELLDRVSGEPVRAASLTAFIRYAAGVRRTLVAESDLAGHITLDTPVEDIVRIEVRAESRDGRRAHARWDRSGTAFDPTRPLEVRMTRERAIGGRVVDPMGLPVAGALIKLQSFLLENDASWKNIPAALEARTDAAGRWHIANALEYPERFQLVVLHPEFVPFHNKGRLPASRAGALWAGSAVEVLERGRRATLRVTDLDGNPVPGARACLLDENDPPVYRVDLALDGAASCELTLPEQERFFIQAEAPGFSLTTKGFRLSKVRAVLRLRLDRGVTRRITLVDTAQQPVTNARVRTFATTWDAALATDATGAVQLPLRSTKRRVVEIERFGVLGKVVRKLDSGATRIVLPEPTTVQLTVRHAVTGEPLHGFEARAFLAGGKQLGTLRGSSAANSLSIQVHVPVAHAGAHAGGGELRVAVALPGFRSFESPVLHAGSTPLAVLAELEPVPVLRLTILQPDGSPAEFVRLLLLAEGQGARIIEGELSAAQETRRELRSHARGSVVFNRPAGRFWLLASSEAGFLRVDGATLGEDTTLRLEPWGCVEGEARGAASVSLRAGSGSPADIVLQYETQPDATGGFHFCDVPPGSVEVLVTEGGLRSVIEVTAGQVAPVFF